MRRMLINIISNAVKYTQNGGKINFDIEEIFRNESIAKFRFTVSDNGCGMSQEVVNKIFEPFMRGESSVTNKVQGAGLGMAIVKSIVDLMGGKIFVSSEIGKGTKITVVVNIKTDKSAVKSDSSSPCEDNRGVSNLSGMNFLCAEDNELNAEILAETLKIYNINCTMCSDGEQLVKRFESAKDGEFDAILTDIQMPVMNGLEAAMAIRNGKKPECKTIPIIAMTANAFSDDVRRSIDAGMNAHIPKPIDMAYFEKTVYDIITKSKLNNEGEK